jgi:hypothetical protein
VRVPCVVLGVCCLQKLPQIAKAPSFVHRKRRPTVDMLACVMSCRACHDCRCWCCAAVCPDLSCSNVFLFRRAAPVSCVSRRARSQRGHGCACTCVCVCVCTTQIRTISAARHVAVLPGLQPHVLREPVPQQRSVEGVERHAVVCERYVACLAASPTWTVTVMAFDARSPCAASLLPM